MRFRLISSLPFLASDETKPSAKTNEPTPEKKNWLVIIHSYLMNISFYFNNSANTYLANVKSITYIHQSKAKIFSFAKPSGKYWKIDG